MPDRKTIRRLVTDEERRAQRQRIWQEAEREMYDDY